MNVFARKFSTIVNKSYIQQLITKPSKSILIDVRETDEVSQGIIPTAKHISVQQLEQALLLQPQEFKQKYQFEKPAKTDDIVFYCRSGKRSAAASAIAEKLGYKSIFDYSGSWLDWSK